MVTIISKDNFYKILASHCLILHGYHDDSQCKWSQVVMDRFYLVNSWLQGQKGNDGVLLQDFMTRK